jgi:hypothetical protein
MDINLTIPHLRGICLSLEGASWVNLREDVDDSITWNLTANRENIITSAYRAQFFGAT